MSKRVYAARRHGPEPRRHAELPRIGTHREPVIQTVDPALALGPGELMLLQHRFLVDGKREQKVSMQMQEARRPLGRLYPMPGGSIGNERVEQQLEGLVALRAVLRAHAEQDDAARAKAVVHQGGSPRQVLLAEQPAGCEDSGCGVARPRPAPARPRGSPMPGCRRTRWRSLAAGPGPERWRASRATFSSEPGE